MAMVVVEMKRKTDIGFYSKEELRGHSRLDVKAEREERVRGSLFFNS